MHTADRGRAGGTGTPAGGTITYQGGSGASAASCGGKPGQLCRFVDGKGNTTGYGYDTAGNLTGMTPPVGLGAHTFTYDAAGRKISETDGNGATRYTCYDRNDRITQVSHTSSNCAAPSGITITYDAAGNLATRSGAAGTATFTFDVQNRPTGKSESAGSYLSSSATYDRAGNVLTSQVAGTGGADRTSFRYDEANNLIALAMPSGSCPATPTWPNSTGCVGFTVDAADRRTETRFPTGVKNTVTFDGSGRPLTITATNSAGTTLVSRAYTYGTGTGGATDTSLVQSVGDGTSTTTGYAYNAMGWLTGAAPSTGAASSWVYDPNGNRTQQTVGTAVTNYAYNAADQLCWSGAGTSGSCTPPAGATSYSYDGQGNQTSDGNTYNGFDQLTGTTSRRHPDPHLRRRQ